MRRHTIVFLFFIIPVCTSSYAAIVNEGNDGNNCLNNRGATVPVSQEGGNGTDILFGGHAGDFLDGGDDNDALHGSEGNDHLKGGGADDWLIGGTGDDIIEGDDGDDIISPQDGNDTMEGGGGADEFYVGRGAGHNIIIDYNPLEGDKIIFSGLNKYLGHQIGYTISNYTDLISSGALVIDLIGEDTKITWTNPDQIYETASVLLIDYSTAITEIDIHLNDMPYTQHPRYTEFPYSDNLTGILYPSGTGDACN